MDFQKQHRLFWSPDGKNFHAVVNGAGLRMLARKRFMVDYIAQSAVRSPNVWKRLLYLNSIPKTTVLGSSSKDTEIYIWKYCVSWKRMNNYHALKGRFLWMTPFRILLNVVNDAMERRTLLNIVIGRICRHIWFTIIHHHVSYHPAIKVTVMVVIFTRNNVPSCSSFDLFIRLQCVTFDDLPAIIWYGFQ